MFDRRLVQYFDWGLLLFTIILLITGLFALYSAVYNSVNIDSNNISNLLFIKQILWLSMGLLVMVISLFFNYKLLDKFSFVIYFGCIILLILVLTHGKYVAGSRRWLLIGPVTFQPSEIAKIAVILSISRYYSRLICEQGLSLKSLFIPFVITIIPCVLILKQPDLGTALLIMLNTGSITWFVKIKRKALIVIITIIALSIPVCWLFLQDYQRERIHAFINPSRDPLGSGYHLIQSKIAIGSGKLTGKGFMKGTQNELSFLPEQHTDFIFSVFAEECGFVGSIFLIILYVIILFWGISISNGSRDVFGKILSIGVCSMIFWQVFINIGMVMGLMPVVGVPLPFVSYGGSSIVTTMLGIGILLNISMRRFMFD